MTIDAQITCIRKRDRMSPHERIQSVGGLTAQGARFDLQLDQAIQLAQAQTYHFWTTGGGKSVWVEVAFHNGNPYLKTLADGIQPDNLLALPQCP